MWIFLWVVNCNKFYIRHFLIALIFGRTLYFKLLFNFCQLLWWFGSEVKNHYSLFQCLKVLKTGSDKIKDLWFYILIESSVPTFFDMIKLRRKEYLPSQKIISSYPVFGYFPWMMPNLKFKYWMNGAKLTCEDWSPAGNALDDKNWRCPCAQKVIFLFFVCYNSHQLFIRKLEF